MHIYLKKILHRTQQSVEAGSSSAAPGLDGTTTTTTGSSRDAGYVPNITFDQEAVYEVIENSKWRKAFFIDGELRWATREGNGIGEQVSSDRTWKMRQIGDMIYLAPKEAHEGSKDDAKAANEKRVDAFVDKVTVKMVAQSTKVPPPTYEELRPFISENLDTILPLFTHDGIIAMDVHGYADNDFDNPGPRLIQGDAVHFKRVPFLDESWQGSCVRAIGEAACTDVRASPRGQRRQWRRG
jgi:hypothetical protein